MEKYGIAYGFFRSDLSLQDLDRILRDGSSTNLRLRLVPLTLETHFESTDGQFAREVKRAVIGRMNYAIEAKISDDSNYLTAIRLANLFKSALGDHDSGAIYWDDGKFHHSNDARENVSRNEKI
ncbi:hypothetical protein J4423_03090 [Candidatus Pacearchaeota archaeon]|nr:hypothetical protein [Candidatus Pacearchaeota archaeon]